MALNDTPKSKMSPEQIWKYIFDEATSSLRIIPSDNFHFQVDLSADDGDSIEARVRQLKLEEAGEAACVGIKTIAVYPKEDCEVQLSPDAEGDLWFPLDVSFKAGRYAGVVSICAMRLRLVGNGKLVGQG